VTDIVEFLGFQIPVNQLVTKRKFITFFGRSLEISKKKKIMKSYLNILRSDWLFLEFSNNKIETFFKSIYESSIPLKSTM